jgi:hypothetical protein
MSFSGSSRPRVQLNPTYIWFEKKKITSCGAQRRRAEPNRGAEAMHRQALGDESR